MSNRKQRRGGSAYTGSKASHKGLPPGLSTREPAGHRSQAKYLQGLEFESDRAAEASRSAAQDEKSAPVGGKQPGSTEYVVAAALFAGKVPMRPLWDYSVLTVHASQVSDIEQYVRQHGGAVAVVEAMDE